MIGRAAIATIVLLTTLSGVAMQSTAQDPRPQIDIFTGPGPNGQPCRPCEAAIRAIADEPQLWRAIEHRFRIGKKWSYNSPRDAERHRRKFAQYNIDSWPTFLITDPSGRELGRVNGFRGSRDLWQSLTQIDLQSSRPQPSQPNAPAVAPAVEPSRREQQIRDAARRLEDERDTMASQLRVMRQELANERARAAAAIERAAAAKTDTERAQLAAQQALNERRIDEKVRQLQSEQQRLEDYDRRRARSDPVHSPAVIPPAVRAAGGATSPLECADGICELPEQEQEQEPEPEPTRSTSWASVGKWLAATAVTILAPQVALPGTAVTGLTVAGWLWRRQRNKNRPSRETGLEPTVGDQPQGGGFLDSADTADGRRVSGDTADAVSAIPRDNTEIEQILSLRQQEQRDPIHDAFFGVLFEDEYRTNPDQSIRDAYTRAMDRFNNVAPLSTRTSNATTTTTGN